jgi:hypothetical protein
MVYAGDAHLQQDLEPALGRLGCRSLSLFTSFWLYLHTCDDDGNNSRAILHGPTRLFRTIAGIAPAPAAGVWILGWLRLHGAWVFMQ